VSLSPPRNAPPSRMPWPPLLFIAVLASGWALDHLAPAPFLPLAPSPFVGSLLIASALANDAWCALTLRRHDTTILPHRPVTALVTRGPYRHSRNPIYMSELALTTGVAALLGSFWTLALTPALFFALTKLAVEPEERHLRAKFGAEFERYAAKTPRWL
jgi:protein-S-isoprenylcysteine O-methyltransferase Ste14